MKHTYLWILFSWFVTLCAAATVSAQQWILMTKPYANVSNVNRIVQTIIRNPISMNSLIVGNDDARLSYFYNGTTTETLKGVALRSSVPLADTTLIAGSIRAFDICPTDTNTIIVFPNSGFLLPVDSVFLTTDGCKTWKGVMNLHDYLDTNDVLVIQSKYPNSTSVAFNPTYPDTVYLAGNRLNNFVKSVEIYRSIDRGNTWTLVKDYTRDEVAYICGMAVHPDNGWVYLGSQGGYILRSKDGGYTWEEVLQHTQRLNGAKTPSIKFSKHNPRYGFATITNEIKDYDLRGGIWRTTDGGDTWKVVAFPDSSLWGLDVLDRNGTIEVLASIYSGDYGRIMLVHSKDAGETWTLDSSLYLLSTSRKSTSCLLAPATPEFAGKKYYVATRSGLFALDTTLPSSVKEAYKIDGASAVPSMLIVTDEIVPIHVASDAESVSLFNSLGSLIVQQTLSPGAASSVMLDVSDLASGIYYIIVRHGQAAQRYGVVIHR